MKMLSSPVQVLTRGLMRLLFQGLSLCGQAYGEAEVGAEVGVSWGVGWGVRWGLGVE